MRKTWENAKKEKIQIIFLILDSSRVLTQNMKVIVFLKDFTYLRNRENERDPEGKGERAADSPRRREPSTGLQPRTLGS